MKPPLVSVVVSNHNYAHFLMGAIESVKAQTYPHIQCIVVDDCSTDDSAEVLDAVGARWPDVIIVRLAENGGQSRAVLAGLAAAEGHYVLLLDADDLLLEDCVATHLSVHLSSRCAVGFTCCDALQVCDDSLVVARNGSLSRSFMDVPIEPQLLSKSSIERFAEDYKLPTLNAECVRRIPPTRAEWSWATTSCMFFRKDALDIVCKARSLPSMRIGTDNCLAHFVNLLTGSIVIDRALVHYRVHGANSFSHGVHLNGIVARDRFQKHYKDTLRVILTDFEDRLLDYCNMLEPPERLVQIIAVLQCWSLHIVPDAKPTPRSMLDANAERFQRIVGREIFDAMREAASNSDPERFLSTHCDEGGDNVKLSQETVKAIAMEVWFEHQRWGLPYKIKNWLRSHLSYG